MRSYTADTSLLPGALAPRSSIQSDVRPTGKGARAMPGAIADTDRFYSKAVIAKSVPSRRRPALTGSGGRGNQQEVCRRIATVRIQVGAPQSGAQPIAEKYSVLRADCAD